MGKFAANFIMVTLTGMLTILMLVGALIVLYEASGVLDATLAWFDDCDHDDAFVWGAIAGCVVSGLVVATLGGPVKDDQEEQNNGTEL